MTSRGSKLLLTQGHRAKDALICEGMTGRLFEVTSLGEVVWEYVNPFFSDDERFGRNNTVFRAYRYAPDFPGLRGKTWHPEAYTWRNHLYAGRFAP
jgi:hypothetical protein